MRDEEDEQKNSRNTLRYFKDFSVKFDEVAAKGSFVAVGIGFKIGSYAKLNKSGLIHPLLMTGQHQEGTGFRKNRASEVRSGSYSLAR